MGFTGRGTVGIVVFVEENERFVDFLELEKKGQILVFT